MKVSGGYESGDGGDGGDWVETKKDAPVRNILYGAMRRDYRPRYFSKNSLNLRMTDVFT